MEKIKSFINSLLYKSDQPTNNDSTPMKFKFKTFITTDSYINLQFDNINALIDDTFTLFKSVSNDFLLIYSYTKDYNIYSLLCYNLIHGQNVTKIAKAHNNRIYTIRHFLDKINNNDLLLTCSYDKYIKIWNLTNQYTLLYKFCPDYNYKQNTYLLSENILFYNSNIYIITSAYEINSTGYDILIYEHENLKHENLPNVFEKMENSTDNTNYLGVYYEQNIPYILAGNLGNVKVFDFSEKKLIYKFDDNNIKTNYVSIIIKENEKKGKYLIASSFDGYLRIWEFNNFNKMIHKIKGGNNNEYIIGLCLISERYIIAACSDDIIMQFDLHSNKMVDSFKNHQHLGNNFLRSYLLTLKTIDINDNKYLIIHSNKGTIGLWEKE